MPVNLVSAGGGTTTLTPASSASNYTVTIPSATTTMVGTDATQTLTNKTISGGTVTSATAQASTSGTSIDFTSIPSWVKLITVVFHQVSTNSTDNILVQLGTSSGVTTSGYLGSASIYGSGVATNLYTTGFGIRTNDGASNLMGGVLTLCLIGSNTWAASGTFGRSDVAITGVTGGSIALAATLDRVRVTTVGGTNTFDSGLINILYE